MVLAVTYSIPGFQDPLSSITHLLAVPVFLWLGVRLIRQGRGALGRTVSLAVLVLSTLFLLSMSAVYHLLGPGTGRYVLRILDINGVFALIAGTVTPIHYILFRGRLRWIPLLCYWMVAATGISLRSVFPDGLPPGLGIGIFLAMGWAGVASFVLLWRGFGYQFVRPILLGGLAYSCGAIVLGIKWPTVVPGVVGPHEIWHLAVLIGLAQHWRFVFRIADGSYVLPKNENRTPLS
ncbi:MAG: DNA-binding protein [Pirellulaceae bacterium]|nr:MAG: DNA-binding protein [Pirellulaceae bacterium]